MLSINSTVTFHYYLYLLLALLRHPESIEKIVPGMLFRKIFFVTIVLKYLVIKFQLKTSISKLLFNNLSLL